MIRSRNSLSLAGNISEITEGLLSCNTKIKESNTLDLDETKNVLEDILKEVDELLLNLDKDLKLELKENRLMQDVKGALDNILMAVEKLVGFGKLIIAFGDLKIEAESSSLAEDIANSLSNILIKGEELVSFGESLIAFWNLESEEGENAEVTREILNDIFIKVEELVAIDELFGDEMVVTINYLNTRTIQSKFKNGLEYFCFSEDKPTEIHPSEACSTKFVNSNSGVNEKVYKDGRCRSEQHLENENKHFLNENENTSTEKLTENVTKDAISCYAPFKEDNFKELRHSTMYSTKKLHFDWSQWAETFDSEEDELLPIPSFRVIKRRYKKSVCARILSCFSISRKK